MPADEKKPPETFRSHLPAVAAAAVGTVLSAVLGSVAGTAGTLAGMAAGSLISGTGTWWAERAIRRSAAVAKARRDAARARRRPLNTAETAIIDAEAIDRFRRRDHGVGWRNIAVLAAAGLVLCAATVTAVESFTGKPVAAVITGRPGHGRTFGGTVEPAATRTGPPRVTPATVTSPPASGPASLPASTLAASPSAPPPSSSSPPPSPPSGSGSGAPSPARTPAGSPATSAAPAAAQPSP